MAGIKANSVSVIMADGDTAADNTFDGFLVGEQVALSTSPVGSAYSWGIAKPAGATSRSDLRNDDGASAVFMPDVSGYYTITCTVDGTSYVLRMSTTTTATTTIADAVRMPPKLAASVTAPASGFAMFCDLATDRIRLKDSSDVLHEVGARAGTFTLSGGAASVADTTVGTSTVMLVSCTSASNRGTLVFTYTDGVGVSIASSDGSDASAYRYALIG